MHAPSALGSVIDAREDARSFRDALGRFATGVVVITAQTPTGRTGMAVNSFASVSLAPPLISFAAMLTSGSWAEIREVGSFCVSVLRDDHEHVARRFTQRGIDRFEGATWHSSPAGHPILGDALSWFDATIETITLAGDHELVVAHVDACSEPGGGAPLVFFGGDFGSLTPAHTTV